MVGECKVMSGVFGKMYPGKMIIDFLRRLEVDVESRRSLSQLYNLGVGT